MKGLTLSAEYSSFLDECVHLPLSDCLLSLGKPAPHWSITRGLPQMTRKNNFRIRLLVCCDGLEADASRFRKRKYATATINDATCRLCKLKPEDYAHFIVRCPALSSVRETLLGTADLRVDLLSLSRSDPTKFLNIVLGIEWINDSTLQFFVIEFQDGLRQVLNLLLTR